MPTKKIIIKGKPEAQKRPRFFKLCNQIRSFDPDKQSKNWIKLQCADQMKEWLITEIIKDPIEMHITAHMPIPKATSKKARKKMLDNIIKHTKKPDSDNIFKKYSDAMSGVVYYDDKQIWHQSTKKVYSEDPHVEIVLIW